jgi:flavin reductase (DIM6/NTAB) family NADH-FMN oxidoreductase RutF
MTVSPEDLRSVMRRWVTGVTVVTTQYEGVRHGMTVNSFTSISLEPPLILVSLERTTRTHKMVKASGYFGVTILSENQQKISDCFAGRHTEHQDRFEGLTTLSIKSGIPFISGGLAFFDCRVVSTYDAGTHTLFIAEVLAVAAGQDSHDKSKPLIYYNRDYRELQE